MSAGNIQCGRPLTSATTGSVVNLLPNSAILLGIFANAAGTVALYDEGANPTGTAADSLGSLTLVAGWNPYPVEFTKGLSVNQSAVCYYVIVPT